MGFVDEPEVEPSGGSETAKHNIKPSSLPFFMWHISATRKPTDESEIGTGVVWLLSKVHDALCARRATGRFYRRSYQCSFAQLQQRHPYLADPMIQKAVEEGATTRQIDNDKVSREGRTQGNDAQQPKASTECPASAPEAPEENVPEDDSRVDMWKLFRLSKEILELFVPLDVQLIHQVIETYWGALDRIARVGSYMTKTGKNILIYP